MKSRFYVMSLDTADTDTQSHTFQKKFLKEITLKIKLLNLFVYV